MKVFVTGGTGFVGQEIIRRLLDDDHQVRALVRNQQALKTFPEVETVPGDTTQPETLDGALTGCDAVIHLVGIIREFPGRGISFSALHPRSTENLILAAEQQGVARFIHMSANGTREQAKTSYHRTKWEAEEHVRAGKLEWTIFRPSLIFGAQDEFVNMLAGMIRKLPLVPVIGDGHYQLQPVSVGDVAESFVAALSRSDTIGKTYHCCGPEVFSYNELLDEIGQALGRNSKVRKIHQPLCLMKPAVTLLQGLPLFPMTRDQLTMLLEGNVCRDTDWAETFSLTLKPFGSGIREYLSGS